MLSAAKHLRLLFQTSVSLEQYRRSSFNHYATGIRGVVEIESEGTARKRGPLIAIKPR